MLPRAAVLKTCCLSTKFHIVLQPLFVFELQRSIISQGFHYLGAVHMKIVFQLFSRLAGKKYYFLAFIYEIFSRLGEIYFGELFGGKILRKANIQNGWHKLEEKWLSFVVSKISGLDSHFMFGGSSVSIRYSKRT